jgi:hypothetical protein
MNHKHCTCDTLTKRIEELEEENSDLKDRLLRAAAKVENLKRHIMREVPNKLIVEDDGGGLRLVDDIDDDIPF